MRERSIFPFSSFIFPLPLSLSFLLSFSFSPSLHFSHLQEGVGQGVVNGDALPHIHCEQSPHQVLGWKEGVCESERVRRKGERARERKSKGEIERERESNRKEREREVRIED